MILSSSSFSSLAHALIEESKLIRLPIQQTVPFSPFSGEKESRVKGIQGVEFLPSFYSVLSKREITRQFLFRTYSKKKKEKKEKKKLRYQDILIWFSTVIRYNGMNGSTNDRRRKVERRKGGEGKKEEAEIIEAWKWTFQRRCSRPGYRDRFIKRWKSFVSASRGRVTINCNKKQKRYGHLARVVQRFRSARQPLIDIYRRWKRLEKLKTGCLSPFLGCASFHPIVCPFESPRFEFVENFGGKESLFRPRSSELNSRFRKFDSPPNETGLRWSKDDLGEEEGTVEWKEIRVYSRE